MAIKKRNFEDLNIGTMTEEDRVRAIEAFGDAADASQAVRKSGGVAMPQPTRTEPTTMLLRFDKDMDLMRLITELAQLEERSKHKIAMKALRIGLQELAAKL